MRAKRVRSVSDKVEELPTETTHPGTGGVPKGEWSSGRGCETGVLFTVDVVKFLRRLI